MRLYAAGIPLHSPAHAPRMANAIADGANFLFSFAHKESRIAVERLASGGVVVDLPDELYREFVASGRPHTTKAFQEFLAAR